MSFSSYNIKEYDKKYLKSGYGIKYPEGHVIRNSSYFRNKNSILDFGCGNGTHLHYFKDLNIKNIYGVETSKIVKTIKNKKFKVHKINPKENLISLLKKKFDIIFSNQVLYYLSNDEINFYLNQFRRMLKKDGLIFTTWLSTKTRYFKSSKKIKGSEMRKVVWNSRLKETTYINFKNKKEIKKLFDKNKIKTLHFGHYDIEMNENFMDSGSFHHIHLGKL